MKKYFRIKSIAKADPRSGMLRSKYFVELRKADGEFSRCALQPKGGHSQIRKALDECHRIAHIMGTNTFSVEV